MRPLEGLRVLDFSRVVSGPFAGRMLSDLGADVVKIEPPDGDLTRLWGEDRNGIVGFYQQQNAGKRNVCIDMRADGSIDLVKTLAAKADIVIENYRAGVMERMGIGWSVLSQLNPKLIMVSISGFGQDGPDAHRGAFAPIIEAETGLIHRQAEFDQRTPTDPMLSIADTNAGLHALVGVLAALHASKTTGHGTYLDIAMFDTMLATDDYIHHAVDASAVERLGGEYYPLPEGGWILVSGQFKHVWNQVAKAGQLSDPTPKGADLATKIAMRRDAFRSWFASFATDAEATGALDAVKLDWGIVASPEDAVRSRTATHRSMIAEVDDHGGGTRGVINSPYRFSNYESGPKGGGRVRGEDNADVLREWIEADDATISALTNNGVLQQQQ